MTGFTAEPARIAGFGVAAGEHAGRVFDLSVLVSEARLQEADGLLTSFATPVNAYADSANQRVFRYGNLLNGLSGTLNRAAWQYTGREESSYRTMRYLGSQLESEIREFPGPAGIGTGSAPDVEPPPHEDVDMKSVAEKVGGAISVIEQVLNAVFGWSLLETITEPISGNYAELSRAGDVLIQAGAAAAANAANLRASLGETGQDWTGGAADSCADHVGRLADALDYQDPLNRVIGEVYKVVADEFEIVGEYVGNELNDAIQKIVTTLAGSSVPLIGQAVGLAKAIDAAKDVWDIIVTAKEMVEALETLVSQVEAVTDVASGEVDDLQELSDAVGTFGADVCPADSSGESAEECAPEEQEENLAKRVSAGLHYADIAQDVGEIAEDAHDLADSPEEDFALGNPRRPGA